jgi:hypothetical protein
VARRHLHKRFSSRIGINHVSVCSHAVRRRVA